MSGALKLAIIGGGPSAFYVASRLIQQLPAAAPLRIHIYDRLWAPHGLVRYGVAPDHPKVKNCTHKFDKVASDPRVQFFGNVHVSAATMPPNPPHSLPLTLSGLFPYYTHLVFATGASLPRLHPALPRSSVCVPALDLVQWYTMHPCAPTPTLSHSQPLHLRPSPIPLGASHITLIGHGNVSLDIARLLLTPPHRLSQFDIPRHVLSDLSDMWPTLRHVSIVGRRGPREAQFTTKELREMMKLEEAAMVPIPGSILDDAEKGDGKPMTRRQTGVLKLLREGNRKSSTGAQKTFGIEFWRNPVGYSILTQGVILTLADTQLDPGTGRAISTGSMRKVPTDFLVTSLGYQGDPEVFAANGISVADACDSRLFAVQGHGAGVGVSLDTDDDKTHWFDMDSGHVRNAHGRVVTPRGRVVRNVYAVGWAARGARGVLAETLLDANDVVGSVIDDWRTSVDTKGVCDGEVHVLSPPDVAGGLDGVPEVVERGLYEGNVLGYDAWRRVDEEEQRRGKLRGKERERMSWGEVRKVFMGDTDKDNP